MGDEDEMRFLIGAGADGIARLVEAFLLDAFCGALELSIECAGVRAIISPLDDDAVGLGGFFSS